MGDPADDGVRTIAAGSPEVPPRLAARLGAAHPAELRTWGGVLRDGGIGVVGVRDPSPQAARLAVEVGRRVAAVGAPLVTGGSPGVDSLAIDAAAAAGGRLVLAPAEGISVRLGVDAEGVSAAERRAAAEGRLVLVSEQDPGAPRTPASARARNRLIYGLADLAVVVASDGDRDTTFSGALEALAAGWGRVVAWTGPGAGPTDVALVELGAEPISEVDALVGAVVEAAAGAFSPPAEPG